MIKFKNGMKFLFIGNSATYVNEIPKSFKTLAEKAGFSFETEQITLGGYTLRQHADAETEHGARVFDEIKKGYDVVFLQDNGNCISTEAHEGACRDATSRLIAAIRAAGAEPCFYVRPPYGYDAFGCTPILQATRLDGLFSDMASIHGVPCVYTNRAFVHAIRSTGYDLWCEDRGHTSAHGAYLIICTFFATLFGVSASRLGAWRLNEADASALATIADDVVFRGISI